MTLDGRVCVVTGATSGIGRAAALAFAADGAQVWGVGRSRDRLDALVAETAGHAGRVTPLAADLERGEEVVAAAGTILARGDRVDVLVHSAGAIWLGPPGSASAAELERLERVNLEAPVALTRALLPALVRARGHVVFVNSSAALRPSANNAAYVETKRGLKDFADALRGELGGEGVRVVSVYPGRTATPMQEEVHEHERRPYRPELLLRPEDVVHVVRAALALPETAEITDVSVRPSARLPGT